MSGHPTCRWFVILRGGRMVAWVEDGIMPNVSIILFVIDGKRTNNFVETAMNYLRNKHLYRNYMKCIIMCIVVLRRKVKIHLFVS